MTSPFHVERGPDGTLFVFWRGRLIYKRWPRGQSVVFDPYGPPWSPGGRR